jgi:hypothetical protein
VKLQFISYDNLDTIRSNLPYWVDKFKLASSAWLESEFDNALFLNTKYGDITNFTLDMSKSDPFDTEATNVQRAYGNLKFLSESQASDERLWAGLCFGPFWNYVKYRWKIDKKCTADNIEQHYMFGFGARRSLTRNALSRLWWIGRLTYDESRTDPWELTKFVCENSDYIMHICERNTSNNPVIIRAFVDAVLEARQKGLLINTNTVGDLAKYLNLLGGIYILDCLPAQKIHDKIIVKAEEITRATTKSAGQISE